MMETGRVSLSFVVFATLVACRQPAPRPSDTSPALGSERSALTRIAFGSCANQDKLQPIWETIARAEPDLFLFIGDNVYGDATSADPSMPELSAAYARLAQTDAFARFRAAVPILPVWDGHGYGKNDGGGDFVLRSESKRLFMNFWEIPSDDPRARRPGLYHAQIFGPPGQRVQIISLDTRSFRSELTLASGSERHLSEKDPSPTMLGRRQWAWLETQLRRPAELRLLVSSIRVIADGHGYESWRNLPTERRRLFDLITSSGAGGVMLLSGDRHQGAIFRLEGGPYPLYETTSSSMNSPVSGPDDEESPHRLGEVYIKDNFGIIEIDWQRAMVTASLRSLDGETVRELQVSLSDLPGR